MVVLAILNINIARPKSTVSQKYSCRDIQYCIGYTQDKKRTIGLL